MEQKQRFPRLEPMADRDGRLLMFHGRRYDTGLAQKELTLIGDLVENKSLPAGNTVLAKKDAGVVPSLVPATIEDLHTQWQYQGREDNEALFAHEFAEGASFGAALLRQKPHLLYTFKGLFDYYAPHQYLPDQARISYAGIEGEYGRQRRVYRADKTDLEITPNPLGYAAFMGGLSETLNTTASRFVEAVPPRNAWLEAAGIRDAGKQPGPSSLKKIGNFIEVSRKIGHVAGLIEFFDSLHPGAAVNQTHDIVEGVKEQIFRHAQSRDHHFRRIHPWLHEIWWDERNPYNRYERLFDPETMREEFMGAFAHLPPAMAGSVFDLLQDDSYALFSGNALKPDTLWYGNDPRLKEAEEHRRQELLSAHKAAFWDKNPLWLMFRGTDSQPLQALDQLKARFFEQLGEGDEMVIDLEGTPLVISRNPEFKIPEEPAARVDYALRETEHSWWEYRFLSDTDKRLFVARHILSPHEFKGFIEDWQEEIRERIRVEKYFSLERVFVEEQIEAMGWQDLFEADGTPAFDRFTGRLPFWIGTGEGRIQAHKMLFWEKMKRLCSYYNLLEGDDAKVIDLLAETV